jgi:hypothetical protein
MIPHTPPTHGFRYVHADIPEGMTLTEWRRVRTPKRRERWIRLRREVWRRDGARGFGR